MSRSIDQKSAQQTEHDKRTQRLNFERSQKKGVTAANTPITRMNWLYNMVTQHGEFQEYSDFARSWIQGRQANADMTSRHDRRRSSWWEIPNADPNAPAGGANGTAAAGTAAGGTGTALDAKSGGAASPLASSQPQVPGTPSNGANGTGTAASPSAGGGSDDITIRDVLSNALACEEFRKFIAPYSFQVDFLQAVETYKKKCYDPAAAREAGASGSFKVADLMAKKIFATYLSDDDKKNTPPGQPLIAMPPDVSRTVMNKLRKLEGHSVDAVMFDSLYNALYDSLSKNQFVKFLSSPAAAAYVPLLRKAKIERKEAAAATAAMAGAKKAMDDSAAAAAKKKADSDREAAQQNAKLAMSAVHAQIGRGSTDGAGAGAGMLNRRDSQITVALPSFLSGNYRRDKGGWDSKLKIEKSSGTEYKTLIVDIHGIKHKEAEKVKCHTLVSVDSKTLKCSQKPGFKDSVQFQLTQGTQFVEVSFWKKGKFHAFVVIPIREVVENPAKAEQPIWYRCNGVAASPVTKALDPETEIQLSIKLSTAPTAENSKDHEQLEDDGEGTSALADMIRGKVSLKKRRFQKDGFDLDLTYVTDRIIAMGYPSEGTEGVYRNKLTSVQRFFARRHPNCFRLYNLCSERFYDATKFDSCVARFPFDDHNPPYFTLLKEFCKDVHSFLAEHPQNVAAIHCKAGKGRTGTVIACYLMYARHSVDAESALNFFGVQRTKNNKGVTIPSQIRYVHYFDKYCRIKRRGGQPPGRTVLFLQTLYFRGIPPALSSPSSSIWFTIEQKDPTNRDKKHIYSSKGAGGILPLYHKKHNSIQFDSSKKLIPLNEDVLFTFYHGGTVSTAKMFQFWLNTRFVETTNTGSLVLREDDPLPYGAAGTNPMMQLKKKEIDKADKDKKHKKFPADFRVELVFAKTSVAAEVLPKELAQANSIVRA